MTTSKKALMFLHAYYKEDTRVRREAEALVVAGWDVDVICLNRGEEPREEVVSGVRIKRANIARSKKKTTIRLAWEYVRFLFTCLWICSSAMLRKQYDVVFTHNMPNFLIFASIPAKLRGTPTILDMHDSVMDVYGDIFRHKSGWQRNLLQGLLTLEEKLSASLATEMITVNRPIMEDFQNRLGGRKYFLLHNSPDLDELSVSRGPARPAEPEDVTYILHHGNILERSGVDRVLPVLSTLNADGEKYRLEVHGRGPFYQNVQDMAADLGVAESCDFCGPFSHESITPYLERASCGVVLAHRNRLFDYALPNKFLEYVGARVPIIAQRLKTLEEYFPESMVQYVDTEDELKEALEELRADPVKAQQRADLAYERLHEISWETERPKFLDFVDAVRLKKFDGDVS
ncbi:glycosyltransferase [Cochlodiniinecator piscidefendens]|uniref:glycosyltransferase n=1 Tax=Cochlodiniinecator piscidefendens TaxID=2715756 RepID=UPI00140E1C34|nr:glycosyltransferase [Cochlodiniinecator piscidefendens]